MENTAKLEQKIESVAPGAVTSIYDSLIKLAEGDFDIEFVYAKVLKVIVEDIIK